MKDGAKSRSPTKSSRDTWSRVARLITEHAAVKQVRLNVADHGVTVGFYEAPPEPALEEIKQAVRKELSGDWGISVGPDGEWPSLHLHRVDGQTTEMHRAHPAGEPPVIWRKIAWRNRPSLRPEPRSYRIMLMLAGICGVSTLAGFILERLGYSVALFAGPFVIAYFSGGWFATRELWQTLKRATIDIHFLMIAVAIGALFVNAWTEGATLLFLFSLSNALEEFANYRTRKSIESLLKVAPKQTFRRQDGAWVEVRVEEVRPGDELLVKPGELFPVDGVMIEGATSVDESALTGEAIPVSKETGDLVSGGTLNLDGQSVIRVTRELQESALSRICALIEEAQQQKAPAQRFTDAFSRYYTWFAISLSLVVFGVLLSLGRPCSFAFYRAMTVLVVASPCALVLSIPSAILVAIAAGARRGILFRGGVAIENLGGATQFAFDKTGTLTTGNLLVKEIEIFGEQNEEEVLRLAASVAAFSTHPLARAVMAESERRKLTLLGTADFLNLPGLGMEATVEHKRIFVGSRRFLRERGFVLPEVAPGTDAEVWVAAGEVRGLIRLQDEIRPAARGVMQFLKRVGASVTLLTGDRAGPAALVAEQVGITDVRAELSPQAKLQCIHEWRSAGKKVAMVGDGINDAPSLTAADVSIGMGARGSDAALEQADVILMHDRIENVEEAYRLSRAARSVIRQNIAVSLGVIFVLIISALLQKINLTTGVIGHEGSTVLVVLNGLRLLRFPVRR